MNKTIGQVAFEAFYASEGMAATAASFAGMTDMSFPAYADIGAPVRAAWEAAAEAAGQHAIENACSDGTLCRADEDQHPDGC